MKCSGGEVIDSFLHSARGGDKVSLSEAHATGGPEGSLIVVGHQPTFIKNLCYGPTRSIG